jgi:acyl-CoA dehydrogenase
VGLLKEHRFFAMIIKKEYGGLEFSAYAQSRVLQKLSGVSGILAITVGVPNSLGPGELLQHYGTEEQKNHYLPRLARGQEIPCFALTSPEAAPTPALSRIAASSAWANGKASRYWACA